jgi:hypothetical protein
VSDTFVIGLAVGLFSGAAIYAVLAEIQDRLERRRRRVRAGVFNDRALALRADWTSLVDRLRRRSGLPVLRTLPHGNAGLECEPRYRITPEAAHLGCEIERRERFRRDLADRGLEIDELSIGER